MPVGQTLVHIPPRQARRSTWLSQSSSLPQGRLSQPAHRSRESSSGGSERPDITSWPPKPGTLVPGGPILPLAALARQEPHRRSHEAEGVAELVLQVALIREVHPLGVVH